MDTSNNYVHFCRITQKAEQPVEIPKCWKVWARLYPGLTPVIESTVPFILSTTLEAAASAASKALHWKRTRAIGNQLVCMAHQRGQAGSQGCTWIGALWRAAAGGTALGGSDVQRSTDEAKDICAKSKPDLIPNWYTILRQTGIFSLFPNAMSLCKRTKAEMWACKHMGHMLVPAVSVSPKPPTGAQTLGREKGSLRSFKASGSCWFCFESKVWSSGRKSFQLSGSFSYFFPNLLQIKSNG